MRFEGVFHLLGRAATLLAGALCLPLLLCLLQSPADPALTRAFLVATVTAACVGGALRLAFPWEALAFGLGELFAALTGAWLLCTALGALPFVLSGHAASPLDACFEVLSGLTTSGATIFADPARLPEPLLLWRALTQWCGAAACLSVSIAMLPALGAGRPSHVHAEAPGSGERLLPRFRTTLRWMWALLVLVTLVEGAALWRAGLAPFEALCLALSTSSSGGFATRADSLGGLPHAAQWVALAGMVVSGFNALLLAGLLRGRLGALLRNSEARVYGLVLLAGTCVLWLLAPAAAGTSDALRRAVFAAGSALSSSGLHLGSMAGWSGLPLTVLLLLVACGACSGSSGSGVGLLRLTLLLRSTLREVGRLLLPASTQPVRVDGRPVEEQTLAGIAGFCILWLAVLGTASLALMLLGLDQQGAYGTALSALSNTGWGAQAPGASIGWADLPATARLVCMACMLIGRLEVQLVLVLLLPQAWRR